jgi:hypothetical protein
MDISSAYLEKRFPLLFFRTTGRKKSLLKETGLLEIL